MNNIPAPPPGFVVEGQGIENVPPPPPGFQMEQAQPQTRWAAPGVLAPIQYELGPDGKPVGARFAMPQIISDAWNAVQAPGRALQGEYNQLEVTPEGGVSQFDPRMMSDASSLAGLISPTSPASRLGAPFGAQAPQRAAAALPEIDDLYAVKNAAYADVDKLGARYTGDAIDQLYSDMYRRLGEANIDPSPDGAHKATVRMLERLQDREGPMSLTRLDQMRQIIRRDVIDSGSRADEEMGRRMIQSIDDFIENAGPGQITGAAGQTANFAIKTARTANTVLRKAETLEEALRNARLNAAASGSGGNIDNAIRQQLARIIKNDDLARPFTQAELKMMDDIITRRGGMDQILRVLGKISPSGNGLMAALGLGATAFNPLMAAAPAVGLAAKTLSDRATQGGVDALTRQVRTGGATPLPRLPSPITPRANTTLLEQQIAPVRPAVEQIGSGKYRLST